MDSEEGGRKREPEEKERHGRSRGVAKRTKGTRPLIGT